MKQFILTIGHTANEKGNFKKFTRLDVQQSIVETLESNNIEGFSIWPVVGFWQGSQEESTKVEIIAQAIPVKTIAKSLCEKLSQDCVMITITNVETYFINS